jgi:uncharacterized protein YggU (UPF0235/DUF167 family)
MPGYKKYFKLLDSQHYPECDITSDDAKRAIHIYGPDVIMLKGKTTRKKSSTIQDIQHVPIPTTIKDNHPDIKLSVDYMYIQGIPMLHTIAKNYKFRTIEAYPDKKKANKELMLEGVKKVINMYKSRELPVVQINADNEFNCIREEMRPATMNIVAADEHVGDIE